MNKPKKIFLPELRFPDFINAPEWAERTLGSISPSIFDGTHQTPTYTEEGIPFFSVENLISGNKNKFISEEDYLLATNKNKPAKDDVLLTRIGNIGFSAIVNWDYEFSVYVTLAVVKKSDQFNSYYLHSYFQSDRYQKEILSKSLMNAVPCKINMEELRKTKVLLPSMEEQGKIADCFFYIDEHLATQNAKLDSLKSYRKGMIQKLFPAEDEIIPQLRFPEFNDNWSSKALGELIEIKGRIGYRGYTTNDIVSQGEGAIALSPSNVTETGSLKFDKATYISWPKFYESPEIVLEKGFTVLVKTGSSYGKAALIQYLPEKCTINPQIVVLKPRLIDEKFLFLVVSNQGIQNQIERSVVGGAIPTLSQESITKFKVLVPSIDEQHKIAECIQSIDVMIDEQIKKVNAIKAHKKGLLQRLFPPMNDINI